MNDKELNDFIAGAEWVIKDLTSSIHGGAGRALSIQLFPIIHLIKQAKQGKITEVWLKNNQA